MVIVDEKMFAPPPAYVAVGPASLPLFTPQDLRRTHTLVQLPSHLLLRVVYEIFPRGQPEGQRKTLYWLCTSLRLVSRALYVASMHVLRSTYIPAYARLIRAPYTSDPFPMASAEAEQSDPCASPVQSIQRETRVFDRFLALKVHEDVLADESELHMEREESFRDLFDLMQPRSRLEDLVRVYGTREGIITTSRANQQSSSAVTRSRLPTGVQPISFAALSVSFSPRRTGLILTTKERKRTIVEVPRTREETLEASAMKLTKELKKWLFASAHFTNVVL
ncbi:hypothetical protein AcW1_002074 [Taiwanofungus camphoratus]|nr:hypothetical protein AcV5_010072 [Antrodia cinnamomea]KAI0944335.1 hypothetical protein AcW1_002074 [Antrodia cinnamomea]